MVQYLCFLISTDVLMLIYDSGSHEIKGVSSLLRGYNVEVV